MIDKPALLNLLAQPRRKYWMNELALKLPLDDFVLMDLLDLTLHENGQTAFHAVWLLDTVVLNKLPIYVNDIDLFIAYSRRITHHSCQRHYARIFMFFTASKDNVIKAKLAETDLEPVVELCFDWLIDPKVKVAVKACAAGTLCNLSQRYKWVAEELQNQLHHLMQNGSPAIQATGRRLLSKLNTNK
jgi:hypothetical protein